MDRIWEIISRDTLKKGVGRKVIPNKFLSSKIQQKQSEFRGPRFSRI